MITAYTHTPNTYAHRRAGRERVHSAEDLKTEVMVYPLHDLLAPHRPHPLPAPELLPHASDTEEDNSPE